MTSGKRSIRHQHNNPVQALSFVFSLSYSVHFCRILCTLSLLLSWPAAGVEAIEQNESGADTVKIWPDKIEFGGPDGVYEELINSYRLRELGDSDFLFGFKAFWLYQKASETLGEEDDALGQIYRFSGSWTLLGRDSGHPGRLEWRVEHRSGVGSRLSPTQLGDELGAEVLNPGFGYSPSFNTDLSVFNWTQVFNDQKAAFAIGRLAFDVYLDGFAFQTFSRGFINQAFIFSPTMAGPGIGALGAISKGFVTDNVWVGGHIYDGNAVSGEFDMDTFKQSEWLKAVEIGWTPSAGRRETDRIQFTYWDKDALKQADISSGRGWVVSASWKLNDLFPFLRFGHSDGGAGVLAKDSVSAGLEYTTRPNQAWSLGLGWANPVNPEKGDEYVFETSYKFQLLRSFSLLPNMQLLWDPANSPEEDQVWVVGLRGIMTL